MVKHHAIAAERSFNIRSGNPFKTEEMAAKLKLSYGSPAVETPFGRLCPDYKEVQVEYEIRRYGVQYNKGKIPWESKMALVDNFDLILGERSSVSKTLEEALKRFGDLRVYAKRTGQAAEDLGRFFTKKEIPDGYERVWLENYPDDLPDDYTRIYNFDERRVKVTKV